MSEKGPIQLSYAAEEEVQRGHNRATRHRILLAAGIGVVVLAILIPSFGRRNSNLAPRTACAANLNAIGKSCLTYAESSNGPLPVSLHVLTYGGKRAYCQPRQLICPKCGGAYIYVPGHTNRDDPTDVMAYELLSYHDGKGANVLRMDGSTRWLTPKEYGQAMTRVEQHLLSISNQQPNSRRQSDLTR